jgi:hypothetical protein
MATARRTSAARKTAAAKVTEIETPAPAPTVRRRRPAAKKAVEAAPAAVVTDAVTSVAAPNLVGADGSLTRHTMEYTVDLLDPGTEPERDYSKVLAKDPSEVHLDFVEWVKLYVGYEADARTVQILISTYAEFQRTPWKKAKTIQRRVEAAQKRATAEASKKARAAKAAAKEENAAK